MKIILPLLFVTVFSLLVLPHQPENINGNKINVNGIVEESEWISSEKFYGFKTILPDYGMNPSELTEVYFTYDEKNIYAAFKCYDKESRKIKSSMTKRDDINSDDWVCLEIDPFNDAQSAYIFKVNPQGVQEDGTVNAAGIEDLNADFIWMSSASINDDGYYVEIAVPFKSLRFKYDKIINMKAGFKRNINRKSETAVYPVYDPAKGSRLSQLHQFTFTGIDYRMNIEITPSYTIRNSKVLSKGNWQDNNSINDFGITGKFGITSDLTIDATYNPDFSHVEGDAGQVDVNLRRALFYPEKRPFFLEGMEHYDFGARGSAGFIPLRRIVNTRSIVDPLVGLKITGKAGEKNVISSIAAVDDYNFINQPGYENKKVFAGVFRFKRALNEDGFAGAVFTSRTTQNFGSYLFGTDGRIRINGDSKVEYHFIGSTTKEFNTDKNILGSAAGIEYFYKTREIDFESGFHTVSNDFRAELGYLGRTGISLVPVLAGYMFYFDSSMVQRMQIIYNGYHAIDKPSGLFETSNWIGGELYFQNQTWLYFGGSPRTEIFAGKKFNTSYTGIGLFSQPLNELYVGSSLNFSKSILYDISNPLPGKSFDCSVSLIFQPISQLRSGTNVIYVDFFNNDGSKLYNYTIYRNSTTFNFNKNLFVRSIVEYNTYHKKASVDIIASFTYIPGTVLQCGYGSLYEQKRWNGSGYDLTNRLNNCQKMFFLKASYLWSV